MDKLHINTMLNVANAMLEAQSGHLRKGVAKSTLDRQQMTT